MCVRITSAYKIYITAKTDKNNRQKVTTNMISHSFDVRLRCERSQRRYLTPERTNTSILVWKSLPFHSSSSLQAGVRGSSAVLYACMLMFTEFWSGSERGSAFRQRVAFPFAEEAEWKDTSESWGRSCCSHTWHRKSADTQH